MIWFRRFKPYILLALICVLLFGFTLVAFYPGFMSNDSINQYLQATGIFKVSTWHPPIMAYIWKALIAVTGKTGSLLVMQLGLLWISVFLLSTYVFNQTKSKYYAALPIIIGLLPYVINHSGVIWKDIQMAYALLLAVSMHLMVAKLPVSWKKAKLTLITVSFLLLAYGLSLRYNVVFSLIPLVYVFTRSMFNSMRTRVLFVASFIGLTFSASSTLNKVLNPEILYSQSAFMVDDIAHTLTADHELQAISDPRLEGIATRINKECIPKQYPYNLIWLCNTASERSFITQEPGYSALRAEWLRSVMRNPEEYIVYRVGAYKHFLFPYNSITAYVWQDGVAPNDFGLSAQNNIMTKILRRYVDFTSREVGFLFRPYFWLLVSFGIIYSAFRLRRELEHSANIIALSLSAAIYILSYFPITPGSDIRYTYWSSLALSIAILLVIIDLNRKYKFSVVKVGVGRNRVVHRKKRHKK